MTQSTTPSNAEVKKAPSSNLSATYVCQSGNENEPLSDSRAPLAGEETVAYRAGTGANVQTDAGVDLHPSEEEEGALSGTTLGQYQLIEVVGKGSMGRVYRAEHLGLHRPCAVKVMNPRLVERQPLIRERFWAEARAVANLLHPHVVTVHNLGSDRGYHFIEMEYVAGGLSLRELVVREGPLDPYRASDLTRQVVLALQAAHSSGLVHRDVKPANVLLDNQGKAKLADFGLVGRIDEMERAGLPVVGTPSYMAPELFGGVAASHQSDLYAVGVMLYYLLSSRLPFACDQLSQLIQKHRSDTVPDVRTLAPTVPDALALVLERCLAKRPPDRYASAEDLASDLQRVILHIRDNSTLVSDCLKGLDCFVQGARDFYRIVFRLPADRLQEVYAEFSQTPAGEKLLSVFSVCGPADPSHFEFALRLNDRLTYGSLSVRNVNGQPMFVMNRTFSRDHVCSDDIRAAMIEIARRSDRVEQQLSDADLY